MTTWFVRSRWWRGARAVGALAAVAGAASAAFGQAYTIRSGDTVSAIASHFGVSQGVIVAVNHLADPNRIYAGRTLVIPVPVGADNGVPSVTPGRATAASAAVAGSAPRGAGASAGASGPVGAGALSSVPDPLADVVTPGPLTPVITPAPGASTLPADLVAHASRLALLPTFRHWAAVANVPAGLLEAVAWMESGWQATVVSRTGAVGIGQIEPQTAAFISTQLLGATTTLDSRVPDLNIRMSATYLAWLLRQTKGDVATALGGYYQGLTTLRAKGPLNSTRRYVAGVGALWGQFRSG